MIKAIIFDIGGVITPIEPWDDWMPTKEEQILVRGAIADIAKVFEQELKEGKFTDTDFSREFRSRARGLREEVIDRIFKSICRPNRELLKLISELSGKYDMYTLVNASFGWTELRRGIHGLDNYFKQIFVSYSIGISKPDPGIFRHFLENTGLTAEECLFIDDKKENVAAAQELGMGGYVFDSVENLKNYLEKNL